MTKEELIEKLKDYPDTLDPTVRMTEPNQIIEIFDGDYVIEWETHKIDINGKIQFEWFPNMGTYFYGTPKSDAKTLQEISNGKIKIVVDGLEFGQGFILTTNFGDFEKKLNIKGTISNKSVLGDRSIAVETVSFSIPNLREFHGGLTKKLKDDKISSYRNRIVFKTDNYEILIDKQSDYKKLKEKLTVKGGYIIQYSGKITRTGKPLLFNDLHELLHCFDNFLWFLNGRRSSAIFLQGVSDDQVIWTDYTHYTTDIYKAVQSWPSTGPKAEFETIWDKFYQLWKTEDNKNFISSAIHWYVEANGHTGYSEGSLILAQTALELIYNWWIVEEKKLIAGKDAESISASNKIRLILSQLNIPYQIPSSLNDLNSYADESQEIIDGPEAIVQIRNAIVHSQIEKRKKLTSIGTMAKYQALQLSIWYIELAMLKILEYDGKYFNRCAKAVWASEAEEFVPWNDDTSSERVKPTTI